MATYTSKLKDGQTGWLIRKNEVTSMPIGSVTIKSVSDDQGKHLHTSVIYGFRIYELNGKFKDWEEHPENKVFGSKEDLIASL